MILPSFYPFRKVKGQERLVIGIFYILMDSHFCQAKKRSDRLGLAGTVSCGACESGVCFLMPAMPWTAAIAECIFALLALRLSA
jgi:hypothetical protein